jgi:hypothetical protein
MHTARTVTRFILLSVVLTVAIIATGHLVSYLIGMV